MKAYKLFLLTSFFCLLSFKLFAENPCGIMYPRSDSEDWGIGAYQIPNNFCIEVYDSPELTNCIGEFVKNKNHFILKKLDGSFQKINPESREYIGHYNYEFLKIYSTKNNYLKILGTATISELYIRKNNMDSMTDFLSYSQLLFELKILKDWDLPLGVNLKKTCLNLRTYPSLSSDIIKCLVGNDYENEVGFTHLEIIKTKGKWAKIEAKNYIWDYTMGDCNYKLKSSDQGWLKAISENGFPNIWYPVSAY